MKHWIGPLLAIVALGSAGCGAEAQSLDEARAQHTAGDFRAAARSFSALSTADTTGEAARGLLAALMASGRYADAVIAARDAVARFPDGRVHVPAARALLAVGDREGATTLFAEAAALRTHEWLTAELELGVLELRRGEREAALERFDRFIDVYNDTPRMSAAQLTAVGRAVWMLSVRDPQLARDALKAFDEAVAADPGMLEAHLYLGDLFLEKYNGTDAVATFQRALDLAPSDPRAQLGMAKALAFDGGDVNQWLEQALETNPNFVSALVFRARQRLDAEDYGSAREDAEHALEIDPGALEALTVLAASHRLQEDAATYAEVRDRVLVLNPAYADLFATVAELSANHRLYQDAVDLASEGARLDPSSARTLGILGLNELRVGRIDEGRQHLDSAFAIDPFNVWFKNTLDLLDTFGHYRPVSTPRFELFLHEREAELLAPYVGEVAERALASLSERYGVVPPTPIRLEVFPSHADFSVRTVGLAGLGALGVSFGKVIAMDSPSAYGEGEFNWASTLWHEIAHSVHMAASRSRVPRWFTEGCAVYEQRRAEPGWGHSATPSFLAAMREDRLLPVSRLNDGFVRPSYPEQVVHSYYQGSLVCEWIEEQVGFGGLLAFLEGYGAGRSTEELLESVLGMGLSELDRRFDTSMRDRFEIQLAATESHGSLVPEAGRLQVLASENPSDFYAQLATGMELYRDERFDEAIPFLERAAELYPEYGGLDGPYIALGSIARTRGDHAGAARYFQGATRANENNFRAGLDLAEAYRETGQAQSEVGALERVVQITPSDGTVHSRLAELYAEVGNLAGAVRAREALVALDPVDRAQALYHLAVAENAAGDLVAARRSVMGALEIAPGYEEALDLLLEIRAAGPGGGA